MKKKNDNGSAEELVIQYLQKNKNFFINYPKLLDILNLPTTIKSSNKIIDLNAYRSKKIKEDYDKLNKQFSEILKAGSSHIISQKHPATLTGTIERNCALALKRTGVVGRENPNNSCGMTHVGRDRTRKSA